jgi:hypothetical protein
MCHKPNFLRKSQNVTIEYLVPLEINEQHFLVKLFRPITDLVLHEHPVMLSSLTGPEGQIGYMKKGIFLSFSFPVYKL